MTAAYPELGLRLQEAREARLLTQAALAEKVDITRASISAFEKGLKVPGIETLQRIALALSLPLSYFRTDRPRMSARISPVSYRRKVRASLSRQHRVERMEEWLADIYSVIGKSIEFPPAKILDLDTDFESLSNDEIEGMALKQRELWGMNLGPIENLTLFCEASGIVIGLAEIDQDIDGASTWRSDRPFMILNMRQGSAVRRRMSLAHELGHIVLHRLADESDFLCKERHDLLEKQASLFAGAFLFPAKAFAREITSLRFDFLIESKRRWKLSMQAIVMRGLNLGIFNADQVEYFYRQLVDRGFSRSREPLDDQMPAEEPALFRKAIAILEANDISSAQRIFEESHLGMGDFEKLTGVSIDRKGPTLEFKPRKQA